MADRFSKPDGALDKEIHIRLSARSVLRSFILILLLVSVFYLGRWSVNPSDSKSNESNVSGFSIGSWFSADTAEEDIPAPKAAPASAAPVVVNSAAAVAEDREETSLPAPAEETNSSSESDEVIITKYSKVALAVSEVTTQWKGTYGKITAVQYTINNKEEGTIKPDHFVMIVEGYDDFEKKLPLPLSSKTIKAGESKSANLLVPQGFAYSESSAGDLKSVKIIFKLIDGNDKEMALYEKQYVLKSS